MKAFELIRNLQEFVKQHGSQADIIIGTGDPQTGRRLDQQIAQVLWSQNKVLLISQESFDLDPINSLPEIGPEYEGAGEPY